MLWQRLGNSIQRHGVRGTVRLGPRRLWEQITRWIDPIYDAVQRVSTRGVVELDQLDIDSTNKPRGIRYEPTRARPFTHLLSTLRLPTAGGFIDFGCGKGRVLLMAAAYGFENLVGVDFAEELCAAARRNIAGYAATAGNPAHIEVVHADAADFPIRDDLTVFYFFNPFDAVVMRQVLSNILDSLSRAPRDVFVIYHNPLWRAVMDECPQLAEIGDYSWDGCRFLVYHGS